MREVWLQGYTSRMSLSDHDHDRAVDHLHCIGCGYDLHGSTIGGRCPECALPVERSVRQGEGKGTRNLNANAALMMGVLSLVLSVPLGLFAIYFFYQANKDYRNGDCSRQAYRWAIVGLVLGVISFLLFLALLFAIAFNPGGGAGGIMTVPTFPF